MYAAHEVQKCMFMTYVSYVVLQSVTCGFQGHLTCPLQAKEGRNVENLLEGFGQSLQGCLLTFHALT